ncbi:MAG: hypothetical protein IH987_05220 [Planctomycetes bacterium]|nr:hypothetical protein [Planctomycetota bacterium]
MRDFDECEQSGKPVALSIQQRAAIIVFSDSPITELLDDLLNFREMTLEEIERHAILSNLKRFGNHRETAAHLGVGIRTIGLKLKKWRAAGIEIPHYRT